MTFDEIIGQFADSDTVPEAAIRAALAEPGPFVEQAMALIDRVVEGRAAARERRGMCVLAHVLGEIGDTRALHPLLRVLATSEDTIEELFGDAITVSMGRILISLTGDDHAALEALMLDTRVEQFARNACFQAWTHAALTGRIDRDKAHEFLETYPSRLRLKRGDYGLSSWTEAVTALRFADLEPVARRHLPVRIPGRPLWKQPPTTYEDFEALLAKTEFDPDGWTSDRHLQPFESTIGELSSWYGYSEEFRRKRAEDKAREALEPDFTLEDRFGEPDVAFNPYRDVGRNDPCPCGSGKKYKKCCLV